MTYNEIARQVRGVLYSRLEGPVTLPYVNSEKKHIDNLIARLRNTKSESKRVMLDEAADTIERLYAELHDERIMRQVLTRNLNERLDGGRR